MIHFVLYTLRGMNRMKKRVIATIVAVCVIAAVTPVVSRAVVIPYFMAVNDTLLPFNDDTMPYVSGNEIYVPPAMFSGAGVWAVASEDLEWARLYRGPGKYADFLTGRGVTQDQDGNNLQWPAARRIGGRFYVPLQYVCDFFGLTFEIIEISRDIIPQEQMRVIRIKSRDGVNGLTFVGLNRNAIRNAYNEYYAPPPPLPTVPPDIPGGVPVTLPPVIEPQPVYSDVTIYISFYDISAGGTDVLFEILDAISESGYKFCFFVSENDINEDPGLIRKIYGSGHMIGLWLEHGSSAELNRTASLLFEATKIKTILVSTAETAEDAVSSYAGNGLIVWRTSQSLVYDDTLSVEEVTTMISTESGASQNIISSCSVNAALMLSGILSYLREYEYNVMEITETVVQ